MVKCPGCGLFFDAKPASTEDERLCLEWAVTSLVNVRMPNEKQWDALQKKEYIPTYRKMHDSDRMFKLDHGHCGCAVDYDWPGIAKKIVALALKPA